MRKRTAVAAAATSVLVALVGTGAAHASSGGESAQAVRVAVPIQTDFASLSQYSDYEVLELLLAGQGAIADSHPELLDILGFADYKPHTDETALQRIITDYLVYNSKFHS